MGTVCSSKFTKKEINNNECGTKYTPEQISQLRGIYLAFVIFWLILIIYLQLYKEDSIVLGLMCIPIILFIYTYSTLDQVEREIENQIFQANYLSISLLVVLPLFFNLTRATKFTGPLKLVIIAIIFILLGLVDMWLPIKLVPFARHFKSCLETIGLLLLVIAVYMFYRKLFNEGNEHLIVED